jgi:hypothetical protein
MLEPTAALEGLADNRGREKQENHGPLWPEAVPSGLRVETLYQREFSLSMGLPTICAATSPAPLPATLFPGSADTAQVENATATTVADGAKSARYARELLECITNSSPVLGPDLDGSKNEGR